jgi:threonine aldolase
VPLETLESAHNAAKELGLAVHLDGARLFNAAVALNVDAKEITKFCDSVMFCLSKGLGAPVGSILCGSKEFIEKARLNRKLLGGGMRQIGIYAVAGIVALETMVERLYEDHENAKHFATSVAAIPFIKVDEKNVDANLVFFKITKENFDHQAFVDYLFDNKVRILPRSPRNGDKYRIVMHHNVSREGVDHTLRVIKDFFRVGA